MDDPDEAEELSARVEALAEELAALEAEVESRTVHRTAVEEDLRSYVRTRIRRGRARGWGPYIVLLYGTGMTVAAFYLLSGGWAILAMLVIWLSTLGLYVLMVLAGAAISLADLPGRVVDLVRERRP